ncbi:MAG: YfhO family protein [Bacteroidota bacterium]
MAKTTRTSTTSTLLNQPSWFDKLSDLKKDSICIAVMYLIILVLCNKIVFNGMIFAESGDEMAAAAWSKGIEHLQKAEHADPLWIPYVFSGMPIFATLIFLRPAYVNFGEFVLNNIGKVIFFGSDLSWILLHFLLGGIFMYILARMLKLSQLPSLLAGLTMMMNPLAIELAQAGHGSKLITLSYIPLLFIMTIKLFEKKNLLYLGLLSATISTMLLASHLQIAFYGFMLVGLYLLYETILTIKQQPAGSMINIGLFAFALLLGFAIASYVILPLQEYSTYSIRGGSGDGSISSGLGFAYATDWSFHPAEMMNYLIPTTFGLSTQYMTDVNGTQAALPLYWGWMPFTTSTVYVGIVPIILMVLALIYRRNKITKFLAAVSVFFLLIAFGKFSPFVYELMFNYFPYFNKFRIPAMILQLMPITIGLIAAYGMTFLLELSDKSKEVNLAVLQKRLIYAAGIIGGALVLCLLAKTAISNFLSDFMFTRAGEARQYQKEYLDLFIEKRIDVFWGGFLKFALFTCLSLGVIILYLRGNLQRVSLMLALIGILVLDLGLWDDYYINPKPKNALSDQFTPDQTMTTLSAEADTSLFRIFPVEDYEDNAFMYHNIQSIGGYSPAKLKIYQEMRDSCRLDKGNMAVVNMLNVKYIVRNQENKEGGSRSVIIPNPDYIPRTWFVDSAYTVSSKTEIFQLMNAPTFDPRHVALLEKQPSVKPQKSDSNYSKIDKWTSGEITINAYASKPSLLMLSEIYYPAGWKAYVDNTETEIYKTNYILRSVIMPEGKHTVVFKFEPKTYEQSYFYTKIGWGFCAFILIGGIAQLPFVRKRFGKDRKDVNKES